MGEGRGGGRCWFQFGQATTCINSSMISGRSVPRTLENSVREIQYVVAY